MLTKKQKNVFDYIKQYSEKNRYAPSLEEIQEHFGLASVSTAYYHVHKGKDMLTTNITRIHLPCNRKALTWGSPKD